MASREHTDYRNSIKESISAVESLCRQFTNQNTLGEALKHLESKGNFKINSEFKKGLEKFYNYTNDKATGIRHALMDDSAPVQQEDARYMLVMCSAFINYVVEKKRKQDQ